MSKPTRTPSREAKRHHRAQSLHFGVERGTQFGRSHGDRHHLDGLRQAATRGELVIVSGLGRLDLDAQRDGRQPMGLPAECHGTLGVGQHLRGLHVPVGLVNHDFDGGVFQIDQLRQGGVQRQLGEAAASSGNKHATTPFWVTMTFSTSLTAYLATPSSATVNPFTGQ